ncbi:response regulator [Halorubrum sp. DTA98]|uniref:response regulator n=1 Tax=Halorubrum sp. DTA98 TaxID=3402163 RepID=UPI003AAEC1E8
MIVEDEPFLLGMYAARLEDSYTIETATTGTEAIEYLFDNETPVPDVVLLDRRMPGLSGDKVLYRIRDRGLDCRVAMITAIEPDADIVDMEFDAYLIKPVRERELRSLVESLFERRALEDRMQELFSITSRLIALEQTGYIDIVENDPEYLALKERKAELEAETDSRLETLLSDQTRARLLYCDLLSRYKE